jgi:hypothetical protein
MGSRAVKRLNEFIVNQKRISRGQAKDNWKNLQICDFKEVLESPLRPPEKPVPSVLPPRRKADGAPLRYGGRGAIPTPKENHKNGDAYKIT